MKDVEKLDDEPLEAAPAKTSKIVLVLLVLNLGVSGFAAFKAMTASSSVAEAAPEEAAESDVPGPIYSFEPFVVNLNDVENPRFLKMTIDTELKDDEVLKVLDETRVRIARDAVMRYLSSLTIEHAMGEEAKNTIAAELAKRLDSVVGEGSVQRILFAEFVVQ